MSFARNLVTAPILPNSMSTDLMLKSGFNHKTIQTESKSTRYLLNIFIKYVDKTVNFSDK